MTVSLRENLELISDPSHLESSVIEVFETMLGVRCVCGEGNSGQEPDLLTAVVGFGGVLSGACLFRCGGRTACRIASRMTGMVFEEMDDTVKDAMGEICNMLAGAWKGRLPEVASRCGLSVPAVITGRDYKLHVQAPEFRLNVVYLFEGAAFEVTVICDGLQ